MYTCPVIPEKWSSFENTLRNVPNFNLFKSKLKGIKWSNFVAIRTAVDDDGLLPEQKNETEFITHPFSPLPQ